MRLGKEEFSVEIEGNRLQIEGRNPEDDLVAATLTGEVPGWVMVWQTANRILGEGNQVDIRVLERPERAKSRASQKVGDRMTVAFGSSRQDLLEELAT